jgi:periplasmic protein TonB
MAEEVIFRELPETFPKFDKYKKPALISAAVFHFVLIAVLVVIPLLIPQHISESLLLTMLVAPLEPPPPPLPPPVLAPLGQPKVARPLVRSTTPGTLVMPAAIPTEVAKVVDEPVTPEVGVVGGVPGGIPGGIPGGVAGGILGGILSSNSIATAPPAMAPPPPPPPPKAVVPVEPVRVGGMVKEPQVLKLVPPVYPKLARNARVRGTVVLEAIVTAEGKVAEIKVVSGHPLLVEAAIDCVKKWEYEPTRLNGVPISVILTAKVHFLTEPIS